MLTKKVVANIRKELKRPLHIISDGELEADITDLRWLAGQPTSGSSLPSIVGLITSYQLEQLRRLLAEKG